VLTPRQQHCLNAIGVSAWQLRPAPEAATLPGQAESVARAESALAVPVQSATAEPVAKPVTAGVRSFELNDWTHTLQAIEVCENCDLARTCTRKVPGKGFQQADLMIIGEAPGHDEDIQGQPFVGRAGTLLDKMLAAIGLGEDSVYITNILKCRPPGNRDPHVDEIQACAPFLQAQIRLVQPKVILSVGRISAQNLLQQHSPLGKLRLQQHVLPGSEIPLLVTYHPAYLLRTPSEKARSWQDLKALHRLLHQ